MQKTTKKDKIISDIQEMVLKRNAALESLDKEKIVAYAKEYEVPLPGNDKVFWLAVHKSILMSNLPMIVKMRSHNWLKDRGYNTSVQKMLLEHGREFNG